MKKSYLISLTLVCVYIISMPIFGQKIIDPSFKDYSKYYSSDSLFRSFIPENERAPVYLDLNLVFLQRDDGSGGFDENNTEHNQFLSDVENVLNYTYSHLQNCEDSNCNEAWIDPFVSDARIQFRIHRIYKRNTKAWDNQYNTPNAEFYQRYICPGYFPKPLAALSEFINSTVFPKGITVFFTEDSTNYHDLVEAKINTLNNGCIVSCASGAPLTWSIPSQIHIPSAFCKYYWMKNVAPQELSKPWETIRIWAVNTLSGTLIHEIGHNLSLDHTCDHYGLNTCPTTIMNQGGSGEPHNYLPPTEIGRIHYALSTSNLTSFVAPETYSGKMYIRTKESWPKFRSYTDIYIEPEGMLKVDSGLFMPHQAKLEVKGMLYLRNTFVKSFTNIPWGGITVKSGGLLYLEDFALNDFNITVESGGTLFLKGRINVNNGRKITVSGGAYIYADYSLRLNLNGDASRLHIAGIANSGINTDYYILPENSEGNYSVYNISHTGNGKITYAVNVSYIQNEIITGTRTVRNKKIMIGKAVTTSKLQGPVVVKSGASLNVYGDFIEISDGFECAKGGKFETHKQ